MDITAVTSPTGLCPVPKPRDDRFHHYHLHVLKPDLIPHKWPNLHDGLHVSVSINQNKEMTSSGKCLQRSVLRAVFPRSSIGQKVCLQPHLPPLQAIRENTGSGHFCSGFTFQRLCPPLQSLKSVCSIVGGNSVSTAGTTMVRTSCSADTEERKNSSSYENHRKILLPRGTRLISIPMSRLAF